MTIAQLYQHLRNTDFLRIRASEKITMLMNNPVVRITTRAEAEEYAFCFNYVPDQMLAAANHCWALELSYCGRMPAGHPAADYLSTQLLTGYRRTGRKDVIKTALQVLHIHFDRFRQMPLRAAISELYEHLMDIQRQQAAQRERELQESIRRAATAAAEADPREQAQDQAIRAEVERAWAAQEQQYREAGQAGNNIVAGPAPIVQQRAGDEGEVRRVLVLVAPPQVPQTNQAQIDNARNRLQDAYRDDQEQIARAIALSLNQPDAQAQQGASPTQAREKIPLKQVTSFCNANELHRYKIYNGVAKKWSTLFVDPNKARKIQAILDSEPEEGQACAVCLTAEGTINSCGVGNCAGRLCGTCFFTWYHKNEKCPCCRQKFIPVSLRPKPSNAAVAPVAIAQESGSSDGDDE